MSVLFVFIPLIAFLYASVGFGGATGYLAAMSFFGIPPKVMASTALLLNILVASISFTSFYRAGHLRRGLLMPFLFTSVPAAFVGGTFKITDEIYSILLYVVLSFVAIRLLFFSNKQDDSQPLNSVPSTWSFVIGFGIGLLSGMVGIGGGIFLSPIIIFAGWGTPKHASAVSAAFIVLNSISGLIGRFAGGTFQLDTLSLSLIPLALLGALAGSYWGALRFSGLSLRRALGMIMSLAVSNFWWMMLK
ncbi:MAG: sulfite exporter TauE/SafE family protein [Chloroflexota bacterium]